jgi:hypothetical protein
MIRWDLEAAVGCEKMGVEHGKGESKCRRREWRGNRNGGGERGGEIEMREERVEGE